MTLPCDLEALTATVPGARLHGEDASVADLAYDSRHVTRDSLFFCVPGGHVDGHDFARSAIADGAAALVTERVLDVSVPQVVVPSVRSAMPPMACTFFDEPSRAMTVIGVTGTNGKTTTTFMLEGMFRSLGVRSGVMGTVETHIADEVWPAVRTTPEAIDLQRMLARMREAGVRGVGMEASSEGLAFERVEGTWFECGIFTNLTQDHLNTHGTMEAYFDAKALLFRSQMCARAAVNIDDAYGRTLVERLDIPVTTFAIDREADVRATSVAMDAKGSTVAVTAGGTSIEFRIELPGRYNVSNGLGCVAAAFALGMPLATVVRGLSHLRVPGRMERIEEGQPFAVIVDYAHTPDSLQNVLSAARDFTPAGARLIAVFGCGGDRDRTKRPLMGRVTAELADRCIITSDNPRTEDPLAIIAMIEEGARETGRSYESIPDRREAIEAAIADARPGDVIVIAGKGHESGQEFADRKIPFDDRDVARQILKGSR
jgi:UDP-N-acetylmuramoyl-L-alanyl-D-glutamate--2,6-diaminopimelate ligase